MPGGLSSFAEQEYLAQIKTGRDDVAVSACFFMSGRNIGRMSIFFRKKHYKIGLDVI